MASVATPLTRKPLGLLHRNPADPRAHIDWGLLAGTLLLVAGGLLAIYTATFQNRTIAGLDTLYFVKRQAMALAVGGTFIGAVFSPWAIVWGAAFALVAFAGWAWPRQRDVVTEVVALDDGTIREMPA